MLFCLRQNWIGESMRKNKIKKWAGICLAAAMISGCSGSERIREVSLYDKGIALLQKLDSIAESDTYGQIMTTSPEVLEILKEIGDGDYSEPKTVYEVKISLKDMDSFQELFGDFDISFEELPEELQLDFQHRLVDSIPAMITASNGTDALAAVSMITGEDYFLDDNLAEEVLYFYVYEGKYWGAVGFSPHEQGIVSASGKFVALEDQEWDKQKFEETLNSFGGFLGMEITEITAKEDS